MHTLGPTLKPLTKENLCRTIAGNLQGMLVRPEMWGRTLKERWAIVHTYYKLHLEFIGDLGLEGDITRLINYHYSKEDETDFSKGMTVFIQKMLDKVKTNITNYYFEDQEG